MYTGCSSRNMRPLPTCIQHYLRMWSWRMGTRSRSSAHRTRPGSKKPCWLGRLEQFLCRQHWIHVSQCCPHSFHLLCDHARTYPEGQQAGLLLLSKAQVWPDEQQMSLNTAPKDVGHWNMFAGHSARGRSSIVGGVVGSGIIEAAVCPTRARKKSMSSRRYISRRLIVHV